VRTTPDGVELLKIGYVCSTAFGVVGILSLSFFPRVSPAATEKFDAFSGGHMLEISQTKVTPEKGRELNYDDLG